jgi:VWFA-related protein
MRIYRLVLPCILFGIAGLAQNADPSGTAVIHIEVDLVQVDAIVTDSKGHPVKNLTAADFEILQDGKPRQITNVSWVELSPGTTESGRKSDGPVFETRVKQDEVKRTLALVVDDLGLSFDGMARVHAALKRFVDLEMQPGDLVAILRTGAGLGALQQFTADKRLLYAAIDRIKYNAGSRTGSSSFSPLTATPKGGNPREQRSLD